MPSLVAMGQGDQGRFGGGDGRAGQVIHYPTDVQPIFDAKCHGASEPAGGLRLTGELTLFYHTSYGELGKKQLAGPMIPEFTSVLWGDRGNYNGACLPPPRRGCYANTLIDVLTNSAHPKNAKDDHSRMLTERELMILSRWVDTNYQFYGSYFGRQHPQWVNRDPAVPAYDPADFRRKATFEEAIRFQAPEWHRYLRRRRWGQSLNSDAIHYSSSQYAGCPALRA